VTCGSGIFRSEAQLLSDFANQLQIFINVIDAQMTTRIARPSAVRQLTTGQPILPFLYPGYSSWRLNGFSRTLARQRAQRARFDIRLASTIAVPTTDATADAIIHNPTSAYPRVGSKDLAGRRAELYNKLLEFKSSAGRFVDLSRLQLALRGVEGGEKATIRIAVLGLNSQRDVRRLVRVILADALAEQGAWETDLVDGNEDGKGVLIRYASALPLIHVRPSS
jgi:hypothetical protein